MEKFDVISDIKEVLYTKEDLDNKCSELAERISEDYDGEIVAIGILKGAIPFMIDLVRKIKNSVVIDFMDVKSYEGTTTTGEVRILKDLSIKIEGKDVLIIEDIIDTGLTLSYLIEVLKSRGAKSLNVCTLLTKPARRKKEINVKYVGFEIEDNFVIGYGMDYNERYRNLPYIGILDERIYK
ncbi:hypoxanthine phosphoribosyltransferase [Peptoniphilus sp. ING2-D1G]|nr:hypoxanthine phosphoribosyltransferase [Peptoniphilus sp. ING2-D1G]